MKRSTLTTQIARSSTESSSDMLPGGIPGRRTIPKPFSRPSIDVSHHGREWRDITAEQVAVDDIVAGFGKIAKVDNFSDVIALTNVNGEERDFGSSQKVNVFVLKEEN